jgi:polyhydroxyalkanoate synthesis regulator phasin
MNKKMAAIGLTAGLAAGGVAGLIVAAPSLSGAQTATTEADAGSTTAPTPPDATDPGATPPADAPDRASKLEDALAPLVEDGTLTQEQADKVVEALKAAGPFGGHGPGRGAIGKGLDAAASALGLSEDEVRTALRDGQTLADVARSKGLDPQVVIDALVAEVTTHLDEEVASGDLTQEQADRRLAEATARITEMVNEGRPERGPHGRPGADRGDGQTS